MGLDIYLGWTGQTEEEHKAQITGFQTTGEAGYLRSSYNDGGFNSWAARILDGKTFYWIFDYDDAKERPTGEPMEGEGEEAYEPTGFFPDWDACRERALEAIEAAKKLDNLYTVKVDGPFSHGANGFLMYPIELEVDSVLPAFREAADKQKDRPKDWDCYSTRDGLYNLGEPFKVKAVLWAMDYGSPTPVLVCEGEDPHKYYREVLEEVLKFIDKGQQKNGWLGWSG